ncbi:hypothetical protein V6N11_058608 [Hibiscus sabdariffa]|uniref:Uncharacterized protein n=1 Tax=Hibiscus sabdariffa TaxID=183260 RepID=A0ABR2U4Y5_9ROSI
MSGITVPYSVYLNRSEFMKMQGYLISQLWQQRWQFVLNSIPRDGNSPPRIYCLASSQEITIPSCFTDHLKLQSVQLHIDDEHPYTGNVRLFD